MVTNAQTRTSSRAYLNDWPVLGAILRWRHTRLVFQGALLLVALLVLYDGFFGPQLAPKNLAGVLPWVHWRGFVVLALLFAGNLFCFACPFMLVRGLAKRWLPGRLSWPSPLRSKWLAVALLIAFFWSYETFDLWASPWLTAWVALAYFAGAFVIDGLFKGAAFCKYVCPIGQFHFVNGMASPLEVRVRNGAVCLSCKTKDCLRGRYELAGEPAAGEGTAAREGQRPRLVRAGCETWLFQQAKYGNVDCTFCLNCVHACPFDNVAVTARRPTSELWRDPQRSGVGQFSRRPDLAALALVLVFGAFLNAFGMVTPVYELERNLANLLGTDSEPLVLLVLFGTGLIVLPAALVGATAWASRRLSGASESLLETSGRYVLSLVPLGIAMWAAHYLFHFLHGGLTIVPVVQSFLSDIGLPLFGTPDWSLGPLVPVNWVLPLELVVLELGLLASLYAAYRLAADQHAGARARRGAMLPWALLLLLLFAAGFWLLLQPMEMRGTMGVG